MRGAPVFLLMGPTASGKTEQVLELATRFPLEVVSVDSSMVYRGLDIGTAKPTPAERARVPHHLIDLLDPSEIYSVGRFVEDANQAIRMIQARGHLPFLVGGSFLYFRAWMAGLSPLPPANPSIRAGIERRGEQMGWPALHAELTRIDPNAAVRIHPHDRQRVGRALEVYEATGQTISHLWKSHRKPSRVPCCRMVLEVTDRAALRDRVERRLSNMLEQGWIEEVQALVNRGDLSERLPALRSVGYPQLWRHLVAGAGWEETRRAIVTETLQLAKRQMTWIRATEADARWPAENADWRRHLDEMVGRWARDNLC
ncbi:MAG: tRNA (adenosine(37)-N6)-dimethylallyltransferase MiaA [Gammaproteobacteria bacterium]